MTNSQKLAQINNQLDNWQELGLLEHFDLVLNQLPEAGYLAKYRPNDEWQESRKERDFEKGLLDAHDLENNN